MILFGSREEAFVYVDNPDRPGSSNIYQPVNSWHAGSPALVQSRRSFIGGSDARVIMGDDEPALLRLWREKRGEQEPEDLADNLIVQLGSGDRELNRLWYERNCGHAVTEVQRQLRHPVNRLMGATLDGMIEATGAVFEAKFMLPWSFCEEAAAGRYGAAPAQHVGRQCPRGGALDHHRRRQVGGMTIPADRLYQHLLITAEGSSGAVSRPRAAVPASRRATVSPHCRGAGGRHEHLELLERSLPGSTAQRGQAFLAHGWAKGELKALVPEDAREATGHGLRARRSKSGAISFRSPATE